MKDNVTYYNEFSEGYESRRHGGYHQFLDDLQASMVREHLTGSEDVLEVGCGTGLIMSRVQGAAGSVTGVDISPGMLKHARDRGLDVHEASATDLPFEDSRFDLVYSFKVLAHVREIVKAMEECLRVTRPGGVALLEFYNPTSWRGVRKRVVVDQISGETRESEVYTRYDTLAGARRVLEAGGWSYTGHRGVIIFTPFAQIHLVPGIGHLLRMGERLASHTPLGRLGGFLTVFGRR